MKYFTLLVGFAMVLSCGESSQTKTENRLNYFPEQQANVSKATFEKNTIALTEIYKQYKSPDAISFADNVKILQALVGLKAPAEKIHLQFAIIEKQDIEQSANLLPLLFSKKDLEGYFTAEAYDKLIEKYDLVKASQEATEFDIQQYAKDGGYDLGLVTLMQQVLDDDSKDEGVFKRGHDESPERLAIDQRNSAIMDSLYQVHQRYIGKSLVGDKFASVMGVVMMHSDKAHMEKYLPIIHEGVKQGEVSSYILKGLIDIYYDVFHGFQVFGIRNAKYADEATRAKIKAQYGFE